MSGSRPGRLGDEDIRERVASCPGWDIEGGKLHRRLEFPNFVAAFGFMTKAAEVAESLDHHPEWSNVYGRVEIFLTTHDAGGISELDFDLATRLNALVD